MPGTTGLEVLVKVHETIPSAQRLLTIDVGHVTGEASIVRAPALNQVDYYFGKPWASPEEEHYPVTGGVGEEQPAAL